MVTAILPEKDRCTGDLPEPTYPVVGRFLSPDPIGFAGGLNKYAYVGNSPTNAVDPSGLAMESLIARAMRSPMPWDYYSGGQGQTHSNQLNPDLDPALRVASYDSIQLPETRVSSPPLGVKGLTFPPPAPTPPRLDVPFGIFDPDDWIDNSRVETDMNCGGTTNQIGFPFSIFSPKSKVSILLTTVVPVGKAALRPIFTPVIDFFKDRIHEITHPPKYVTGNSLTPKRINGRR